MLSKCANPECSAVLRYLHQGKLFYLAPTPDVQIAMGMQCPLLHERFWLCDRCSKEMNVVWIGSKVEVAPWPTKAPDPVPSAARKSALEQIQTRSRAASAGRGGRSNR
ncbi:MAG TPA: hypothetical protein VH350_20575 [Candidatus Sulfotelmatobacter sp.]|jgi:hypothetical protein|nr:hypothetical protein [Candidatus Sulfotelmatobacter sp.]